MVKCPFRMYTDEAKNMDCMGSECAIYDREGGDCSIMVIARNIQKMSKPF